MKFKNILKEEKLGKDKLVNLTNLDRKFLNILQKKRVDPNNNLDIIKFLVHTLAIENEKLVSRLGRLYQNNWKPGMFECDEIREDECIEDFSDLKKGVIDVEGEYSAPIQALSKALKVDTYFITQTYEGSVNSYSSSVYLPEYNVIYPRIAGHGNYGLRIHEEVYLVSEGSDDAYSAAETKLRDDYDEMGTDLFAESFMEQYIDINSYWLEDEIGQRVDEEFTNMGNNTGDAEEDMRGELGVRDDYNSFKDEIDMAKKEIVVKLKEIQEAEFKKDNIEKEKIIIEKEIEKLGGYIEYDEDNPDHTEFSKEIERLQDKLNHIEGRFEEIKTIIEMSYKENDRLQDDVNDFKEELSLYEGAKLEKDFREYRYDEWKDTIEDDPITYLVNYLGISLEGGVDDGYLDVDVDALIEGAIQGDGVGHFLATYDDGEDYETIDGEEYYFYRTN